MFDLCVVSSHLAQMGLTLCCHRRATLEPSPEPEPVQSEPSGSPASSQDSDLVESPRVSTVETAVERSTENTAVCLAVPGVRLDLSRASEVDWNHPELRIYAVWEIPKARAPTLLAGIHTGRDLAAYSGILGLNQGIFVGLRWRRCYSHERAIAIYWREAGRFDLENRPLQYFRWQAQ